MSPVYNVVHVPVEGSPVFLPADDRADAVKIARTTLAKHGGTASIERDGKVVRRYTCDEQGIVRVQNL